MVPVWGGEMRDDPRVVPALFMGHGTPIMFSERGSSKDI